MAFENETIIDIAKETNIFGTRKAKLKSKIKKLNSLWELKNLYKKAGVNVHVRKGRGTAYNWVDILPASGYFSETDILKANAVGLPAYRTNMISETRQKIDSIIGGAKYSNVKDNPAYQRLKAELIMLARKYDAVGTCVGGSGVYVLKDGTKIDFVHNPNQSEQGLWKAEKIMAPKFAKLGLTLYHEGGWMD